MKNSFLFICLISIFCACKKEARKQYSYWYVNEESFKTNNVRIDRGKARTDIRSYGNQNQFRITFELGYLPLDGSFLIDSIGIQNPFYVWIDFFYNGNYYTASSHLDA